MLEKPTLSDEKIIAALDEGFGIIGTSIEFLPIGNDATSWAYRVMAENEKSYFLKVKKGLPDLRGIVTPRFLYKQGVKQVIAPLPARHEIAQQETETSNQGRNGTQSDQKVPPTAKPSHKLWYHAGEYSLILFPFVNGNNGMKVGLTEAQWVVQEIGDFGARVFLMDSVGETTKRDAVVGFLSLFQPGDVVEAAYKSEENLR